MSIRRLMAGAAGGLAITFGAGHMNTLQAQGTSAYQSADQQFIGHLAAENLLEVRLSQTAQTKAVNPSVKQFAQRMVTEHTSMQKQWMALASKNDLDFKADLSPQQFEQLEQVRNVSGAEFDRAYMGLMVQNQRDNVNAFQNERRVAHSAEVRQLIDRDLIALEEHLRLAQQIGSQVGTDVTATTGTPSDTTSPVAGQPRQTTQNVRADSAFISEVDAANVAELRLARLAEGKAADPLVKRFAQKMATDHSSMRNEWAAVSSRNGLRFTANVSPRHQEQVTRLERLSGAEFDRAYMSAMVQNHQENVNSFQTRGRAAQSPDVRQLVNRSLPYLEAHLTLAQQAASQVGAVATGTDTTSAIPTIPPRTDTTTVATQYPRPDQKDEERARQGNIRADAEFIDNVGAGHFLEVRLGRLAQEKARDPAVKRFGEKMEKDHSAFQEQWSNMESRNGVERKPGMGPNHRVKLERLEKISDKAFDRAYMTLMIQSHQDRLNYWRREGRAARSAPVRQLVNRGIPTLEEHMDMAKRIGNRVGVDAKAALAGRRVSTDRSDGTVIE